MAASSIQSLNETIFSLSALFDSDTEMAPVNTLAILAKITYTPVSLSQRTIQILNLRYPQKLKSKSLNENTSSRLNF